MKQAIWMAAAALALSACSGMQVESKKEKECDVDNIELTVHAGNSGKLLSVSREPVYVCKARPITWVIDKDQDGDYELRANSISIQDTDGNFTDCKNNIPGSLNGKNKISCNDMKRTSGGPWKYRVTVFPVGSPASDPGISLDPNIINN
jgi:hypothetical protein